MRTWLLACVLLLAACSGGDPSSTPSVEPSPSIRTLTPLAIPDMGPPEGEIVADLRQSSRDAALNRFQVWVGNGLARDVMPTSIEYVDRRFRAAIPGERLRLNPSGSERGYPLTLPARPACSAAPRGHGTMRMTFAKRTVTLRVEDEADVVERFVTRRCFELDIARVATLTFDDEVPVSSSGDGTLLLRITPSGRPGGSLSITSVSGTPVLTSPGQPVWRPDVTVRSTDDPLVVELPVGPTRCDGHAFLESGGATAFKIRLVLDGEPGETVVRMSPAGAANAIGFAADACGF